VETTTSGDATSTTLPSIISSTTCACPEATVGPDLAEPWTAKYTVEVFTSNKYYAGTNDGVYMDIIGADGQESVSEKSEKTGSKNGGYFNNLISW